MPKPGRASKQAAFPNTGPPSLTQELLHARGDNKGSVRAPCRAAGAGRKEEQRLTAARAQKNLAPQNLLSGAMSRPRECRSGSLVPCMVPWMRSMMEERALLSGIASLCQACDTAAAEASGDFKTQTKKARKEADILKEGGEAQSLEVNREEVWPVQAQCWTMCVRMWSSYRQERTKTTPSHQAAPGTGLAYMVPRKRCAYLRLSCDRTP